MKNLTRYVVGRCDNEGDWFPGCAEESSNGRWVEYTSAEKMFKSQEACVTDIKDKVAALEESLRSYIRCFGPDTMLSDIADGLKQLSSGKRCKG